MKWVIRQKKDKTTPTSLLKKVMQLFEGEEETEEKVQLFEGKRERSGGRRQRRKCSCSREREREGGGR